MSVGDLAPWLGGSLAAFLATPLLARLGARAGWLDAPEGPEAERKLQARAVPPVGGSAILLGLVLARLLGARPWSASEEGLPLVGLVPEALVWAALLVAFATGLADDLCAGGLSPLAKLAGQALAGLLLAAQALASAPLPLALVLALASVLACCTATNLLNTFDNADGAASGVALLGLSLAHSPAAAPLLGFLPWNLMRPRGPSERGARAAPHAYLGDSGSFLVGMLVLLDPLAWPALLLPAADLARVACLRVRLGIPPWRGDRRHLAHRLQARGLRTPLVLLVLLGAASPALFLRGPLGLALGLLAFALVLRLSAGALDRPGTLRREGASERRS